MKNKITEKLRDVIYILSRRQVGNTTLERKGIENYDRAFWFVGWKTSHAKEVLETSGSKFGKPVSIETIKNVYGSKLPIMLDHVVIQQLLEECAKTIEKQDSLIDDQVKLISSLRGTLQRLMTVTENYQDRCHDIEALCLEFITCSTWQFSKKASIRKQMLMKIEAVYKDRAFEKEWHDLFSYVASQAD